MIQKSDDRRVGVKGVIGHSSIKLDPKEGEIEYRGMRTTDITQTRLVFFFSSRRRHTRFDCDWSSDVCSSDLTLRGSFASRPASPASIMCKPPLTMTRS